MQEVFLDRSGAGSSGVLVATSYTGARRIIRRYSSGEGVVGVDDVATLLLWRGGDDGVVVVVVALWVGCVGGGVASGVLSVLSARLRFAVLSSLGEGCVLRGIVFILTKIEDKRNS